MPSLTILISERGSHVLHGRGFIWKRVVQSFDDGGCSVDGRVKAVLSQNLDLRGRGEFCKLWYACHVVAICEVKGFRIGRC